MIYCLKQDIMYSMAIKNVGCIIIMALCTFKLCLMDPELRLHSINDLETDNILEIYLNGIWRALGGNPFSEVTAQVICNYFGYGYIGYSAELTNAEYNYTGGVWSYGQNVLNCKETATALGECVNPAYVNITTAISLLGYERLPRIKCSNFTVSDIRLTGGEVPSEGRFEILVGTQWGTVCTYSPPTPGGYPLGLVNEDSICQMLGYFNSTIQPGRFDKSQLTNNASSPVLMTLEGCSDLNSLDFETHCNVIKGEFIYCNFHEQDALIMCEAIRLVDGPNTYSGRIETSISGQLVTLCDYLFDIKTANVACNMLGYSGAKEVMSSTRYGVGQMPLYTGRISCNGNEKSLEQCHHDPIEDSLCNKQRIVGVVCQGGPMKLEPFANKPYEGVFTTSHAGKWYHFTGNVSDITAKTLCNMTGFGFKGYGISLPEGSLTIQRQSLKCFGKETNVLECTSEPFECIHRDYTSRGACVFKKHGVLGLYCNDYHIEDVRLTQVFAVPYQKLFEVFVDGEWGITSAELGKIEAQIICKYFGYLNGENTFEGTFKNYKFKIIGDLKCKGNESSPFGCAFEHRGYLDVLEYHFTMVNCTKECHKARYGYECDKDCMCISANTEDCDDMSGKCTCIPGWSGTYCETDINECLTTNICPGGMECVNQSGSLCSEANTECTNIDGGFKCDCVEGYARDNNDTCFALKENNFSNILLIVISSSLVAVLLICVFVGVCCCVSRNRQNGRPSSPAAELPTAVGMKDVVQSSLETRSDNQESSYYTIQDAGNYELLNKTPTSEADYKTLQCYDVDTDGSLKPK
ncbi:deleted in malignant brain tumors 1 protein-like [Mya arenaria]|uniref:deleted in malignant brain tumors 1 protein-like n=1 Tax=Mya arenaria TaxID=6604 RepID=UPI0022E59718|nr:deleted in malignant brain tumors 1 protein-like [Mya arenaria]